MKRKTLISAVLVIVSFLLGSVLVWMPACAELFVSSPPLKALLFAAPFIAVVLLPMYMLRKEITLCEKYDISQRRFNICCFAGMVLALETFRRVTASEDLMARLTGAPGGHEEASLGMIWTLFCAGIVWIFLSRLIFGAVVDLINAPRR